MPLSLEQLKQLAHLSRLSLDDKDLARLGKDLERMMEMVRHVQEVDTSTIEGTVHVHTDAQPLREDNPVEVTVDLAKDAAEHRDGHVVVPKVIA